MQFPPVSEPCREVPLVPSAAPVPPPLASDLAVFGSALRAGGLRSALLFLNGRTPHRFTGVFRFDGDMLRSVHLVDKWDPLVERGDDVPLASAYCAHLQRTGEPLDLADGRDDPRLPWMAESEVVSYCGAAITAPDGTPWGALCHFDTSRAESKDSDLPLLVAAAAQLYERVAGC